MKKRGMAWGREAHIWGNEARTTEYDMDMARAGC